MLLLVLLVFLLINMVREIEKMMRMVDIKLDMRIEV